MLAKSPARAGAALLLASAALLSACRKNDVSGDPASIPLAPSAAGANGCSTPNGSFLGAPQAVPLALLAIGPWSQVTAASAGETLYATGEGASVVRIDVTDPAQPLETEWVSAGTVAGLYQTLGITEEPRLSGIALLDGERLVVVEHTANVLLAVGLGVPDQVELFAGQPSTVPGAADGTTLGSVGRARFSFQQPTQICPTGTEGFELFIADSGNHSLRTIADGRVSTLCGTGFPFSLDGALEQSAFDSPTGLTVSCDGFLLVSELGDFGFGQRLRRVELRSLGDFVVGVDGSVVTLVGDGNDETSAGPPAFPPGAAPARVSRPVSPLATSGGEIYWIDSGTGILRRLADGIVDCPLSVDCASALGEPPHFTPGGSFALTQTPSGRIFVLDSAAATLFVLP